MSHFAAFGQAKPALLFLFNELVRHPLRLQRVRSV